MLLWERAALAFGTFLAVSIVLLAGLGLLAGTVALQLSEFVLPREVGGGSSLDLGGNLIAFPALSITGGAIAASIVWEPNVSNRREFVLLLIAFLVVAGISWTDYLAFADTLISRRAQALLDIIMAVISVAILAFLWRWRPRRATTIAVRTVAAFCLTLFGFIVPTYFSILYVLMELGIKASGYESIKDWIDGIGGIIGLVTALVMLKKPKTDSV